MPEPQIYKGDRFPIGSNQFAHKIFTQQELLLEPNQTLYAFSDGYPDQFGTKGKLTLRRFKKMLAQIHTQNFEEQQAFLQEKLVDWQDSEEQTDDILIAGIRL